MTRHLHLIVAIAAAVLALAATSAHGQCSAAPRISSPQLHTASNCYYDVAINSGFSGGAGVFNAATGIAHPVFRRFGRFPVVQGDGASLTPVINGFSLRSWSTSTDYLLCSAQSIDMTDGSFECQWNLLFAPPTWAEFTRPSVPEFGVRTEFDTIGAPDRLHVTVETAAAGSSFETSAVRNTMTVRNDGPTPVLLGARLAVEPEIEAAKVAIGMVPPDPPAEPLTSGDAEWTSPTMDYVVVSESGVPSVTPSRFYAAASIVGPWTLQPPPTAPNRFGSSTGVHGPGDGGILEHCFGWNMRTPPVSVPGLAGIELVAWFWGDTPETARVLAPGEETAFTVWFWAYIDNPVTCDAGGPYGPVECEGSATRVVLDAGASRTEAREALMYRWSGGGVTFDDATLEAPMASFPGRGVWPVTLDVGIGPYTRQCNATVEVVDTRPPDVYVPPPLVIRTSELGGACRALRSLRATAVDACAADVAITHVTVPDIGDGGADATHEFGYGTTRVIFTATDPQGNAATSETTVTIIDDTPPAFVAASVSPAELWPPNHRLVPVTVDLDVSDTCDPTPAVQLIAVSSSEPADFRGDGRTGPDIAFAHVRTDDRDLMLRAERDGRGVGRVYLIEYAVSDREGNEARHSLSIAVGHDRRLR